VFEVSRGIARIEGTRRRIDFGLKRGEKDVEQLGLGLDGERGLVSASKGNEIFVSLACRTGRQDGMGLT
jgi:hypothetical protein